MRYLPVFVLSLVFATGLCAQGSALQFTPTPNRFVTANVPTTATANVTIEAWVKWAGPVSGNQIIVLNGNTTSSGYALYLDASNSYQVGIFMGGVTHHNSIFTLPVGTWTHVVLENASFFWYVFVNGVYNQVGTEAPGTPSGFLRVGADQDNAEGFNGVIDEVRVSNVVRYSDNFTPSNAPFSSDANTMTLYHFDEGSGQTTADASANGNNGQLGYSTGADTLDPAWAISDAPLPVELVSFSATADRFSAELRWNTATEVNNSGFEVERRLANSQFIKVGFVNGSGTSNGPRQYSFVDHNLSAGLYSYRLKQLDRTGTFKYSQEAQADVGSAPKLFTLGQNYPNPFNPTTNIQFTVPIDERATLKVYNALGQEVTTLFDGIATAGEYHQATFDASRLATGIYIYRMTAGNSMETKKLILVK